MTRIAGLEAGVGEPFDRHSHGKTGVRTVCSIGVAPRLVTNGAGLGGVLTGSQQQTAQLLFTMRHARLPFDVASPGLDAKHSPTNDNVATIAIKAIVLTRLAERMSSMQNPSDFI